MGKGTWQWREGGLGRGAKGAAAGTAVVLATFLAGRPAAAQAGAGGPDDARAVVHRMATLMGGDEVLRSIRRTHLEMTTQWQQTSFREVPWSDRPSFEDHTDIRDYGIPAWRNTRLFPGRNIVNVIRDSVAVTDFGQGPQPLSIAYVDERAELFVYTPDRLVLHLADAPDLALAPDTTVGGEPHRVLRATLDGRWPASVLVHAGTGLPTRLHFRAGHPNDFGLVPWGEMDVEVWYSNWRTLGDVSIPTQWDVLRMGRPYKRMTVRSGNLRADFEPADSFAVSDELRQRYRAEATGPMHDRALDGVGLLAPGLAEVRGFGFPTGAVDTGDGWVLLETGHMPLNLERALAALADHGVTRLVAAVAASTRAGNGGAPALLRDGVPVLVAPAAAELLRHVVVAGDGDPGALEVASSGRWLGTGERRLRVEPVDLADAPGSLVVWAPALGWLYAPDARTPLDVALVKERARERGWEWRALGTARGLVAEGALGDPATVPGGGASDPPPPGARPDETFRRPQA